jgi:outer membrane protein assembly factor BamB/predicted negative regulator of RcsB-dependent stress response
LLAASAAFAIVAGAWPAEAQEQPKPAPAKEAAEPVPKPAAEKPADDPFGKGAKDNGAGALNKAREALQKAKEAAQKAQPQARPLPAQIQMRGGVPIIRRGGIRIGGTADAGDDEPIFFPADRATLQRLSKAQELLEQSRFAEAVRLLGDILDGPEDFFFQPKRDEPIHRSLKAEAQRLIGSLPAEGRQSYELLYGALARQKLDEAIASRDAAALAEVSRRFFHTKAGYEATFVLASHQFDHGHPLAAALSFRRLQSAPGREAFEPILSVKMAICWLRAGMSDKAQEALAELPERYRAAPIQLAGKAVSLFRRDEQALSWLTQVAGAVSATPTDGADQWTMYRGSPSRNTASDGSSPLLSRRWGVPTADENGGAVESMINQMRETVHEQGGTLLCSLHPLAVKDRVFMRSVGGLVAVDFATGKRVWRVPVDDSIRQLLEPGSAPNNLNQQSRLNNARALVNQAIAMGPRWLSHRLWEDATYGTISSDGERVFCIEDLDEGFSGAVDGRQIVLPNGRRIPQAGPRTFNRLAAYDIATEGKLKWEAGGPYGEPQSELAGSFFLGPPLPLADSVYALTELKGEIRLVALDSATGKLAWSQQLAVLETNWGMEQVRRASGVSPSYSDGVLVCPTSAGAVVALDMTTRSLLWGYQYSHSDGAQEGIRVGIIRQPPTPMNNAAAGRWSDATLTIAGGRVLLTPLESNQLHCLNLLDGKLVWQKPREDGLYVGCVHNDKVLVVGRNSVRALALADGEPVWAEASLPLPVGAVPSGRGFYNGRRYHLPLSTAEVAAIDMDTGRIVARSKSRSGTVPGNLICYHGAVISQSIDIIERFDQRDDLWQQIAATIAENPNDPGALARRGELLLDEGDFRKAVDDLRRSFAVEPDPRTRELLVDALLEGLRVDFKSYSDQLAEIEQLIEQTQQRGAFLRLAATGWQSLGDATAAFAAYMRIAALDDKLDDLERVDHALSVRRDRWVQARLKGLIDAASPAERAEMERTIRERYEAATRVAGATALRKFLAYFGSLPIAELAREELARRLIEEGALVEAEQLLAHLERSTDPRRAAAATARYAAMLESAGRHEDAATYYNRLLDRFADVECVEGKTGRQLISAIPEKSELAQALAPAEPWPVGIVEREDARGGGGVVNRHFALDLGGPLAPFYEYAALGLDQQQQVLFGLDGFGRERWRVSLRDAKDVNVNNNPFLNNGQMNPARVSGHVVLVSLGYQILAIDSLGGVAGEGARILWRHELMDRSANPGFQPQAHVVQVPWAVPRIVPADQFGRPLGNIGPITTTLACYQRLRSVIAVHPLTGETLWTRGDTEPGSDVFGDDELLFVVSPNGDEALVVRALDGMELGRRSIAPSTQRMLTMGRRVASWTTESGKSTLRVTDIWSGDVIWQHQFPITARAWTVADESVGVMTPEGEFTLLSLADGKPIISEKLNREQSLSEVYVLRGPNHYVLAASNNQPQVRNGVNRQPIIGGVINPLINGHVHVFDRHTGKKIGSMAADRYGLLLSQPAALPVLTFATHVYDPRSGRARNVEAEVAFLDKRTGKIVHQEKLKQPMAAMDVVGDRVLHQVSMRTQGTGILLTFTGKPTASSAETEARGSDAAAAGRAVLRGLGNWFQGITPPPRPMPPAEK